MRIHLSTPNHRCTQRAPRRGLDLLCALLAVAGGYTSVQPAGAQALEEIVVTAQRREQSLQEVGVSVTAFTGDQIRELGFTNTVDVVAMTPGLNYTVPNAESSQINFFLRGVGLNDFADANENPVAVYVDDVYRPAMGGLHLQLFDMERVEVLRGPQGSLFGRNTTGGLVHFITRRPTDEFEAYVDLSYGEFDEINIEGVVSGPISDSVRGRLSVAHNEHDGYTDNRFEPNFFAPEPSFDYNSTDAYAARGQLDIQASDTFDILLTAYGSDNDAHVGAWQHQSTFLGGPNGDVSMPLPRDMINPSCVDLGFPPPSRPGTDCFEFFIDIFGIDEIGFDFDGDPHEGNYDRRGTVQVETAGASVQLNWDGPAFDLTSITAYNTVDRLQEEDTEAGPLPLIEPTFGAETDTFTQELRIAGEREGLRWLTGLYYFDNQVDARYTLDLTKVLEFVFFDANYVQDTESWSVFGHLEYDFAPNWTILFGLRYTDEEKELDYFNEDTAGFFTDVIGLPTNVAFDFDRNSVGDLAVQDQDNVTGKIELDWRPVEDLLLYLSYSRGVKSAGFNTGFLDQTLIFASNTADTIPFDEETLNSYEVGFKSTLLNGTTRLNGSAFYYDYEDFQTFRFELLNQIIFNSDAEVKGAELELVSSPWEGWDFALGISVLDAVAKDIPSPSGLEVRDREMVAAPDSSLNGLVRYSWPALGGRFAIQAWANYQNELFYDIQNQPVAREGGYTVSNLRVSYAAADDRWEVAAFVHNLTDEEYKTYTFDFTGAFGFNQEAYGAPRWAGVSFKYRWD